MTVPHPARGDAMNRVSTLLPYFKARKYFFYLIFPNPLLFLKRGATIINRETNGSVSEWLMETDCKSVGLRLRWFKSSPAHHFTDKSYNL